MSSISSVNSVSSIESISSGSSTSEDEVENVRIPRAHRIFRRTENPMNVFDDAEFKMRFRFTKAVVNEILEMIQDDIEPLTHRNQSIPAIIQLLLTLRFYACGSFQSILGDHFSVTKSTAGRIIHKVTHLLAMLRNRFINMPRANDEINNVCLNFFNVSGFPNVCGAIDCTHIKIQSPGGENAETFRNRKGYFSINVQVVCDAQLKIMDVVARWPGSTHDSHIFDASLIRAQFENNEFNNKYLLGDSAYACRRYLLTPVLNPRTPAERRYNEAHIRTRNVIERCFGVLKRRFPCLSIGMRVAVEKVIPVIVATCVLHNIAINLNDNIDNHEIIQDVPAVEEIFVNEIGQNNAVRNAVINTIFQRFIVKFF